MSSSNEEGRGGECPPDANALKAAEQELRAAEGRLEKAETELKGAETDIRRAKADIEAAEHPAEIEVKVNGIVKIVAPGTYLVSVFKSLVGVPADRELDVVHHGVFEPLNDNAEITIHECEAFVSHVRTGGSS